MPLDPVGVDPLNCERERCVAHVVTEFFKEGDKIRRISWESHRWVK